MFCCNFLEACSFLAAVREGVDQDGRGAGEKLGGGEGRETIIREYCVRKEPIFTNRGK